MLRNLANRFMKNSIWYFCCLWLWKGQPVLLNGYLLGSDLLFVDVETSVCSSCRKKEFEKIYFVLAAVCVSSVCILCNVLRNEISSKRTKRPKITHLAYSEGYPFFNFSFSSRTVIV